MRAALFTFAISFLTFPFCAEATDYWTCDVAKPSIVTEDSSGVTIHSAGYLQIRSTAGGDTPDYFTSITGTHRIRRQSDNQLEAYDSGGSNGEVITYARGTVSRGYTYFATLDGSRGGSFDSRPKTTHCYSGQLYLEDPNPPSGGDGGGDAPPEPEDPYPSPIVIDLGGGGFRLTDLENGVAFDIDGDGVMDQVAWTPSDAEDGWLALDRNANGLVDDGTELFGNFSPQPESDELHGYRALAVFDSVAGGGNADGRITVADSIFDSLLVWIDSNQDGISQGDELRSLGLAGIVELDLAFIESRRKDRHGNQFRYSARVRLVRGTAQSSDVFLLSNLGV